jgi:RNA polymerase sigma-70 factor (family 1)
MPLKTVHTDDEPLLLSQLKAGYERGFAAIYDIYAGKIYQRLLNLLKDEDIADSLLQDVFLRIWEKRELIDPGQPFKAYLFKIAENLVYDHFRKLSRDLKMQARLKLVMTELYTHSEEALLKKENEALLKEAIENLPPQRRQVFTLCRVEGKSYDEAAVLLGISSSTVSNHLVKATKSVRDYILVANGVSIAVLLITLNL